MLANSILQQYIYSKGVMTFTCAHTIRFGVLFLVWIVKLALKLVKKILSYLRVRGFFYLKVRFGYHASSKILKQLSMFPYTLSNHAAWCMFYYDIDFFLFYMLLNFDFRILCISTGAPNIYLINRRYYLYAQYIIHFFN